MQLLGTCSYTRRAFVKATLSFGLLLLASAFPRNSIALAAGTVEFVLLSGSAVEAVAALPRAFHGVRPRRPWLF
jgi:hypothetical protein